jgi:hypothetical protein
MHAESSVGLFILNASDALEEELHEAVKEL